MRADGLAAPAGGLADLFLRRPVSRVSPRTSDRIRAWGVFFLTILYMGTEP